jgi:uncharacterized repeat protein (TIGR04052 family)
MRYRLWSISLLSLLMLVVMPLNAQDETGPVFSYAWASLCDEPAETATVSMTIDNMTDAPLTLNSVTSPTYDDLRLTDDAVTCADDEIDPVEILAGQSLDFQAAGYAVIVPGVADPEPFTLNLAFTTPDGDLLEQTIGVLFQDEAPARQDVVVMNAWVRPTITAEDADEMATGAPMFPAAVYMDLLNRGDAPDRLIAAASPVAAVTEIHETTMQDEVMQMGPIDGLDLPVDEVITFEPGGLHIMLIDLERELLFGQAIPVTLTFESGAEMTLAIPVYDRAFGDDMDMAMHGDMGDMMPDDGLMTLNFVAAIGESMAVCGEDYPAVGADSATISFNDFRLYVSNIHLLTTDGDRVRFELEQDGVWQVDDVALLDFEDGTGGCAEIGNAALNGQVIGSAPAGEYVGLTFDMGVPFGLNHQDVTTAASPLNIAAMWWNWQGGYKFIRVDIMTDDPENPAWNLHVGSTGCESPAAVIPPEERCTRPNLPSVTLESFDFENDVIVADLASLLTGITLYESTPMPPGCMSGFDDPDCPALFANFGLTFDTGACADGGDCSGQMFFRVAPAVDVTLVERTS